MGARDAVLRWVLRAAVLGALAGLGSCSGFTYAGGTSATCTAGADVQRALGGDRSLAGADLRCGSFTAFTGLAGADLSNAVLDGASLGFADLSGTNLAGASLQEASMHGAVLRGTNLTSANLRVAVMTSTVLAGANVAHASLVGANLGAADLRGADFTGADLTGTQFGLVTCDATTRWPAGFTPPPCTQ